MATNVKQPRRRGELAQALDAAFSGCDQWTVVGPRRHGPEVVKGGPIDVAQTERLAIDAAQRARPRAL